MNFLSKKEYESESFFNKLRTEFNEQGQKEIENHFLSKDQLHNSSFPKSGLIHLVSHVFGNLEQCLYIDKSLE